MMLADGPLGEMCLSPSLETLINFGILERSQIEKGKYWVLLSSCFLCTDFMNLALTEFIMLVFIGNLE